MNLTANEHQALARFGSMNDRHWKAFLALLDAVDAADLKTLTGTANQDRDREIVEHGMCLVSRGALRNL